VWGELFGLSFLRAPVIRIEEMDDAFAFFGFERRPLVDEVALKERYLRFAADRHPDVSGGADVDFHLVQEAYKTLREPAARLRHLIELEFPAHRRNGGAAPHAELFVQAGSAVQAAREVSQRLENTGSALARALLSPEIAEALRRIREAHKLVQETRAELVGSLESLDRRWPNVSSEELSALASSFRFLTRWTVQLSEWEFRLSNG
jgi:curved DNA-binding protein CbpA